MRITINRKPMKKETRKNTPSLYKDTEKTKNYYRLLTESSHDIIVTHDIQGKIIYVNPAWVEATGYSAEETQGKSVIDFIPPKLLEEAFARRNQRSLDAESVYSYELEIISKTGAKIPVEVRSSPIAIEGEEMQEILIIARDIKKRKEVEQTLVESEASYRDLFNSIDDAIYIQNKEGQFIDVNHGAEKLYGFSREELIGRTPTFLSAPEKNDLASITKKIQLAFAGEPQHFEFWGKKANGEIFPKEVHIYKGNYFGEEVIIALARDITERKKNEAALKRQLNELNILQATAFTSTQATEEESLIRQITDIIGNTLYPDNFGFLLLDKKSKYLSPHPSYQGITKKGKDRRTPLTRGITGKVASSGHALRVADISQSSAYEVFTPSTRSELCVPIKTGKQIIGVINAESSKEDFFTDGDERLLNTIAGQVAIAIEKMRLFEIEKKRRQVAERLQKSAAILTTTLSREKAIELILEELSAVVSFDSASIQLLRGGYLEIAGGRGKLVLEKEKNRRFPIPSNNPNTVVIETCQPLVLENAPRAYPVFLEMPSIKSWLGVPLITHEHIIGILTLDSDQVDHFTEDDVRLVTSFASHAAIAIQNASLFNAEQKRRQEAETLRETALAITASLNLEESIQRILEQLSRVLPYDSASVQILQNNELILFGGHGWKNPTEVKNMRFSLDGSNPNTRVILEKEIVILDNAPAQHAPFRLPPHDHIHSWMGVPLIIRDKVIGMLAVDSTKTSSFTEESAKVAQSFANQAAIAVENARLFDAEQTRRQEAETLRQSAHTISSSLNLDEVLETILASIKRTIPYDSAAIMLMEKGGIKLTSGYGLPSMEKYLGKTFPINDPLSQKIIESSFPLILSDAQESPFFIGWAETSYVRGWMGIPLIVRGKVIGYITLDSKKIDAYRAKDAELAQTFAHQAASAVENARLYQEAVQAAERRAILHRLSQDILRGIQSPETTYLAIHHAAEELMVCDAFVISLRGEESEADEAVYLVDLGKRYNARKVPLGQGIISFIEKIKGSFFKKDLATGDLQIQNTRFGSRKKIRSLLISPMYVGDKLIGAISTQSYTPNSYDDEEKVLLEMLASHAAAAIENARLFSETEHRGKEFAELYKLTQDLIAPQEMDRLLKITLERATNLLGISSGDIYLYNNNTEEFKVVSNYGLPDEYVNQVQDVCLSKNEGMVGVVAKTLKPFHVDDYQVWEGKSQKYNNVPFTSVLEVPMLYAGNLIGVLALYETHPHTHYFTKNDERIMTLFATQVAGAIHSTKQFKQINNRLLEVEVINRISIALRSAETLDEMFPIVMDEVCTSLNVEVSSLWLGDPATKTVYRAIARGWLVDIKPEYQPDNVGLIGHVYQSGENHIVANMKEDPYIRTDGNTSFPNHWAGLWAPVHSTTSTIGVVAIMAKAPRRFNKSDIRLLTTLAEIVGNAIHRARLHKRTKVQVKRLSALRDIDKAISTNSDLRGTLQLLVNHALGQLSVDAASVLLLSQKSKKLTYFVGKGFLTSCFSDTNLPIREGLPGETIQKEYMQSISEPAENQSCQRKEWFVKEKFVCYYCVPLTAKGKTLGVFEIFHREAITPSLDWLNFLQTLAGQATIAIENNQLFKDLKHSNQELALAYDTTLEGWGKALELRDKETQGHTLNVTELTLKLARRIGIDETDLIHIYRGALLHDIGKMGIPDNILRKPGPLTKEEWVIMRQHPQFAYDMISSIPYLLPASDIPYCHHERWDGDGYPRGLKGKDIPLAARIFSVVDVWDALLSDRHYRKAWEKQTVIDYINNESGSRFDPKIVEVFLKMIGEN